MTGSFVGGNEVLQHVKDFVNIPGHWLYQVTPEKYIFYKETIYVTEKLYS